MNPSTALARVLVDELVRGGLTDAVLSPGSRSAPLAFALHDAEAAGRLRLHVRIDERSAAFLALGLAKASGRPVAVVTTSGTATANLHPAVLEAAHSGVQLVLLTADRPPELRATGANQTVDQVSLYGTAVRLFLELGTPGERVGDNAYWRSAVCRVLAAAGGELDGRPGPVHVNLGLREPLVPDDVPDWVEPLDGRSNGAPWTARSSRSRPAPLADDLPDRTVVVLGDGTPEQAAAALRLADRRGFPVVAEPSAGRRTGPNVVAAAELVLGATDWVQTHRPDRVLVVGRPTLSRAVGRLATLAPTDVVADRGDWTDAPRTATRVLTAVPAPGDRRPDAAWLRSWLGAGRTAAEALRETVDAAGGLTEPVVSAVVAARAADLLVVGSSKPPRDLFHAGPDPRTRVLANRGAAGIDGLVSTAIGAALASGPALALLGDLTFLHDSGGLVLGPREPRPDLTIVVVNNDGGAIFGLLEQGDPSHADAFERVFGTAHGVDLAALCAATHTPHVLVHDRTALAASLEHLDGLRVVEVRTDRTAGVALDRAIRAAVTRALAVDVG